MRRLWKGLLVGSLVGSGLAWWAWRRRSGGWQRDLAQARRLGQRTVRSWGRQVRDAQGAWRVGRRVMRRRRFLGGVSRLARRLLLR